MEDQPKENPRKRKAANTGPRKKRNNNNDDAIDNNKSSNPTDTKRRRTPGFADYHPGLVGDWVDRNYQLEQDSRLPKQQVFAEYYAWGDAEGLHLMSPNIFGKFLFQHFGKGLQSCRPGRIGSQTPHYRNLARRNPSSSDGGRGGGGIPGTTTTTSATTTTPAAATTHTPRSTSDGDGQRGSLIHKTPGDHTRLFGSFQIGRSHQHHQHHPSPSPPTPPPHPRHYQHLRSPPPPPSSATTYHAYAMPTYPSPPPIQDHPASSPLKPKRGSPGEMPNPYPGYTTTSNTNNKKCKISTTTTTTTTTVNVTLNTHDAVRDYGEGEEEEEEEEELVGGVPPHLHHAVPLSHEMNLGMAERSENVHPKYGQDYNQRGAAVQDPETEYHMLHQALQKYKETLLSRCDSASSEVDEDQGLAEQHEPQASLEANVELYGHYLAKGWGHKAKAQFSECLKALGQEVSTYTQGDHWHIVLGAHILAASGELWVAGFSSQQLLAAVQSRHRHKPEMVEAAFRACVRWYAELCNKSG